MAQLVMALVLPALTDCRWWFESLLVHSGVSSATRRKATGADKKKSLFCNMQLNVLNDLAEAKRRWTEQMSLNDDGESNVLKGIRTWSC